MLTACYRFFLYYDENFVGYLLEPLLRFTATGVYPHAWASHNLGVGQTDLPLTPSY